MNKQQQPMTEEIVKTQLEAEGAKVKSRSGRNEHYGSPRDFSFEVKGIFENGLGLQIIARQYNYRDPWETSGRINDLIDISLLYQGSFSEFPKGYVFFQGTDTEKDVDSQKFSEIIQAVKTLNPKLFTLQGLTGDL
ncbi:MAG: hypothetical protein OQK97_00505 [Deltaproteobacteria bacterium]|nr:hypothetical protein [Deltaproteobacteria bacterium]MCW8892926.1 hypothetical protein [Deltaproteobacteria bacterium]